jgi:hypothetical protein
MQLLISEEEASRLLRDIFRLSHPVSLQRIEEEFIFLNSIWGQGKYADPEFIGRLHYAYEDLKDLSRSESDIFRKVLELPNPAITIDGFPIEELGCPEKPRKRKVYDDGISRCLICKGAGYKTIESPLFKECSVCFSTGKTALKIHCRDCDKGKFTLSSGAKVNCKRCGGNGYKNHPFLKQPCRTCRGTKVVLDLENFNLVSYRCKNCAGAGKIL